MLNANEQKIINLIRTSQADTQSQLCKLTKINSSTMTYLLGRLRKKGLVVEIGKRISGPGKPAVVLKCAPPGHIIAIAIDSSKTIIGLMNTSGFIFEKCIMEMDIKIAPEKVLKNILTLAGKLLKATDAGWDTVSLIGLSINGTVSNGILEFSTVLPWRNLPIVAIISKLTGREVVCSDGRCRAVTESRQSIYKDYSSILYFNVADGVSVAYVAKGELFLGLNSRIGEIGHVVFKPNGYLCGCGQKGCLQTLISGPAICREIADDERKIGSNPPQELASLLKLARKGYAEQSIDKLVELAYKSNSQYARVFLRKIELYAAQALAVSIALFNPHVVLINGYVFRNREQLILNLRQKVHNLYAPSNNHYLPEFRSTVLGDETGLQCIAMLCSDELQIRLHERV